MDDQSAQAGAALPGGAGGREHDAAQRDVEVGGGSDDRRVVATELEDRPSEASRDQGCHLATHRRRARGAPCPPTAVEPVAETIGTPSWATSAAPTLPPPSTTCEMSAGASLSAAA